MTEYLTYEDPQTRQRSAPIAEDNAKARGILERAGWRVVAKTQVEDAPAPEEDSEDSAAETAKDTPKPPPKAKKG